MKSTLVVSSRGQITLPSPLRKRMGIKNGGVLRVEVRGGQITLSPAAVVDVEIYSDAEIRKMIEDDRFTVKERKRLESRLALRK